MKKVKSDKEISLQILNIYNNFFNLYKSHSNNNNNRNENDDIQMNNYIEPQDEKEENITHKGEEAESTKKMINDIVDNDNNDNDIFTEEVLKQINDECIRQETEQVNQSKMLKISQLPPLIPKELSSSFKYANDICAMIAQYDTKLNAYANNNSNGNGNGISSSLQKEFELFIMKLERQYYIQKLPTVISKIIDRTSNININNVFYSFTGPYIIGSYANDYHFYSNTIDILFYCTNMALISKNNNQIMFERVITLLLHKLILEADGKYAFDKSIGNMIKVLVIIKSFNTKVKLCIYFVDKDNKEYEDTIRNIKGLPLSLSSLIGKETCGNSNDKVILCKIVRLWRRKWQINEILPEIMDYIAVYHYTYSISEGFVKVLYLLYTMTINDDYHPWIKQKINEYSNNNELKAKIGFACRKTFTLISQSQYNKIFLIDEYPTIIIP